eukprot:CAMPEP_0116046446 /NCGR_PEP_ID=MMETSP0321-20121206/28272_1 /TAXON_ID=163516 /ORGANISM="Leptocylindrus danicus var. danicus, Strain B650" /LENGTH=471 /DNA_ID=CAMNT_0003528079 /DNA_START=33 /DNA_END=1448 /DNA_ORIENTATION=-
MTVLPQSHHLPGLFLQNLLIQRSKRIVGLSFLDQHPSNATCVATKSSSTRTISPKSPNSNVQKDSRSISPRSTLVECHEKSHFNGPTVSPLFAGRDLEESRVPRNNLALMNNFFALYESEKSQQAGDSQTVNEGGIEQQGDKIGFDQELNESVPAVSLIDAPSGEVGNSCQENCDQLDESSVTEKHILIQSPVYFLCSEQFLESNSTLTAELTSGLWNKADNERHGSDGMKFVACDTPLVDETDVDIELPGGQSAIVVAQLSSWRTEVANGDINTRHFIRRIVQIAATGKYVLLSIFINVDIPLTAIVSKDISLLQTAVATQNGSPCSFVDIKYTAPSTLSYAIGSYITSTLLDQQGGVKESDPASHSWLESYAVDLQVQERARFLMQIAPAMTVYMALECIKCFTSKELLAVDETSQSITSNAMSLLIQSIAESNKNDIYHAMLKKGMSGISCQASCQLWMALTTALFKT